MEEKKKKKRHPVTLGILIIALAVMIFSIVKLAGIQKDYKESEKTFQTLESEYVVHPDGAGALWQDGTRIQFEALRKEIRILWHGCVSIIITMSTSVIRCCIPEMMKRICAVTSMEIIILPDVFSWKE